MRNYWRICVLQRLNIHLEYRIRRVYVPNKGEILTVPIASRSFTYIISPCMSSKIVLEKNENVNEWVVGEENVLLTPDALVLASS